MFLCHKVSWHVAKISFMGCNMLPVVCCKLSWHLTKNTRFVAVNCPDTSLKEPSCRLRIVPTFHQHIHRFLLSFPWNRLKRKYPVSSWSGHKRGLSQAWQHHHLLLLLIRKLAHTHMLSKQKMKCRNVDVITYPVFTETQRQHLPPQWQQHSEWQ